MEGLDERIIGTSWKLRVKRDDDTIKVYNNVRLLGVSEPLLFFEFTDSQKTFSINKHDIVSMFEITNGGHE